MEEDNDLVLPAWTEAIETFGKRTGEIVQGTSQAIGTFPDSYFNLRRQFILKVFQEFATKFRVSVIGRDVRLGAVRFFSNPRQVFVCPLDQRFDFIELVRH
jgi:hypothetical protein